MIDPFIYLGIWALYWGRSPWVFGGVVQLHGDAGDPVLQDAGPLVSLLHAPVLVFLHILNLLRPESIFTFRPESIFTPRLFRLESTVTPRLEDAYGVSEVAQQGGTFFLDAGAGPRFGFTLNLSWCSGFSRFFQVYD